MTFHVAQSQALAYTSIGPWKLIQAMIHQDHHPLEALRCVWPRERLDPEDGTCAYTL